MYCVDVPLHAGSGLFMFTLPPKRGTSRKRKLIKKAELNGLVSILILVVCITGLLSLITTTY